MEVICQRKFAESPILPIGGLKNAEIHVRVLSQSPHPSFKDRVRPPTDEGILQDSVQTGVDCSVKSE